MKSKIGNTKSNLEIGNNPKRVRVVIWAVAASTSTFNPQQKVKSDERQLETKKDVCSVSG